MVLKHTSGSNYRNRKKEFIELLEMVREIVNKSKLLNLELAKFTELDMQCTVASRTRITTRSLNIASDDILKLEELFENGGKFKNHDDCEGLTEQLHKLRLIVDAEYDSKFIGAEK